MMLPSNSRLCPKLLRNHVTLPKRPVSRNKDFYCKTECLQRQRATSLQTRTPHRCLKIKLTIPNTRKVSTSLSVVRALTGKAPATFLCVFQHTSLLPRHWPSRYSLVSEEIEYQTSRNLTTEMRVSFWVQGLSFEVFIFCWGWSGCGRLTR